VQRLRHGEASAAVRHDERAHDDAVESNGAELVDESDVVEGRGVCIHAQKGVRGALWHGVLNATPVFPQQGHTRAAYVI